MFAPLRGVSVSDGHRERRGAVNRQAVAGAVRDDPRRALRGSHPPAELRVRPLPPLVLQAAHIGEAVEAGGHVARVDGLPEVDGGAVESDRAGNLWEGCGSKNSEMLARAGLVGLS